jgi:predicted histone-like DNA-binding protein
MSIKIKSLEKFNPQAPTAPKKFYATVVTQGESNIDVLTTRIEKISTVSGADIRAVLYALVDVISVEMSEGRIVRLGDLGYMRVSVASKGETTADDVSSNSVQGAKILFTPGAALKKMLQTLKFVKM